MKTQDGKTDEPHEDGGTEIGLGPWQTFFLFLVIIIGESLLFLGSKLKGLLKR